MTDFPYGTTQGGASRRTTPFIYRIPLLGRMARETAEGDEDTPFYAIAAVFSLWFGGFLTIGYPALIIGALILTAVIFLFLLRITLG